MFEKKTEKGHVCGIRTIVQMKGRLMLRDPYIFVYGRFSKIRTLKFIYRFIQVTHAYVFHCRCDLLAVTMTRTGEIRTFNFNGYIFAAY